MTDSQRYLNLLVFHLKVFFKLCPFPLQNKIREFKRETTIGRKKRGLYFHIYLYSDKGSKSTVKNRACSSTNEMYFKERHLNKKTRKKLNNTVITAQY